MNAGIIGTLFGSVARLFSFLHTNWDKTFEDEFYSPTLLGSLGEQLQERIQARTPVYKGGNWKADAAGYTGGALRESITFEVVADKTTGELLHLYADSAPQLAAWGRVYAAYVEGLPIGMESVTIDDPAQMFFKTATEDMDIIESTFGGAANKAAFRIVSGEGVPL